MAVNGIKYSTLPQTLALKKGNWWIGTGDVSKGPTQLTDYWAGISPPSGGYSVYLPGSQGPNIYTPSNDPDLIILTNQLANKSFGTGASALDWYNSQVDKMVLNIDYPPISTSGLVINLDAAFTPSYPKGGSAWYDMGPSGTNGTLLNGITFDPSSGGSLLLDGTDDWIRVQQSDAVKMTGAYTLSIWFKNSATMKSDEQYILQGVGTLNGTQCNYNLRKISTNYRWTLSDGTTTYTVLFSPSLGTNISNIVCSFDPTGNATVYVNGPSYTSIVAPYTTYTGTNNRLAISGDANGGGFSRFYTGNIYQFLLYNKALSSSEVLQNYQAMFPRFLGANIVTSGLTLYLDAGYSNSYGGTGTAWYNVSGASGGNGTLTNGPLYSATGPSISFDGTDDRVPLSSVPLPAGQAQYSMEAFWNTNSLKTQVIYEQNSTVLTTGTRGCMILLNTGYGGFNGQNADLHNVIPYSINTWYHWVITVDTTLATNKIKIYVNGTLSYQGNPTTNANSLSLGGDLAGVAYKTNTNAEYFSGNVGITRVYNRILSSDEVLQNFNAQRGRFGI